MWSKMKIKLEKAVGNHGVLRALWLLGVCSVGMGWNGAGWAG